MNVDWFTVVAQIINFGILVWLLQRFLYQPVIGAMEKREAMIAERLQSAEASTAAAEKSRETYESQLQELHEDRDRRLSEIQQEVEATRRDGFAEARQQIETARADWQKALARDRQSLIASVRLDAARHAVEAARHLLRELSDVDLQDRFVTRFLRELSEKDGDLQTLIGSGEVIVESALPLDDDNRKRLQTAIESINGDAEVDFRINPDIIGGVEIQSHDSRVAWSARECLAKLDSELVDLIDHSMPVSTTPSQSAEEAMV